MTTETQPKRIGRPRGKTIGKTDYKKPKTFTLSESTIEWIETQSRLNSLNGSAYLEEMIRKVRTLST